MNRDHRVDGDNRENIVNGGDSCKHRSHLADSPTASDLAAQVDWAIQSTLPTRKGEQPFKNLPAFRFARALKAIPAIVNASPGTLRVIVTRWHKLARAVLEEPFEETWIDFRAAWKRVRYAAGEGPLDQVMKRVRVNRAPDAAMELYEQPQVQLLVSICRELQREVGNGEAFYLSARKAGELLGVEHTKAWRWLGLLLDDGWLQLVHPGTKMLAARYAYRELRRQIPSKPQARDADGTWRAESESET